MKTLKWIGLGFLLIVLCASGYLFVGGHSPIVWSSLTYTDSVAQASKEGKPLLVEFWSPL